MVTRAIANAQKKVEAHNFEIRKQLLEYDDVMNKQREVIYRAPPRRAGPEKTLSKMSRHDRWKSYEAFVAELLSPDSIRKSGIERSAEALQEASSALDITQGRRTMAAHSGTPGVMLSAREYRPNGASEPTTKKSRNWVRA